MLVYLDVSCINRPFDDQSQVRIRLEAEAVATILERIDDGQWQQVSSRIAELEIVAVTDQDRRQRLELLLPPPQHRIGLTENVVRRAESLCGIGLQPADAAHVASAELAGADVFLTCDDRLLRVAVRKVDGIRIAIANPLTWIREQTDAHDS